jgi:hypothetical protein
MTKKRTNYLYKFTGTIQKKSQRTNPKHAQHYYQLKVKLENNPTTKIFAFQNKAKAPV